MRNEVQQSEITYLYMANGLVVNGMVEAIILHQLVYVVEHLSLPRMQY